ncbi:hypothetical protein CSUI_000963 [Cystoisospora suis]|uniref:Uncharacterized protein n=1 Tax=Cystoisospora suis TaxID=483139 RepID=A0A2C6LE81_9APIC|nr:hypothetical protein CSUI_000963 [Cystoisospora suis]
MKQQASSPEGALFIPSATRCNVVPAGAQRAHVLSQAKSTFVQAGVFGDRGSKQMVAQRLTQTAHLCDVSSVAGGRLASTYSCSIVDQQHASTAEVSSVSTTASSTSLRTLMDAPKTLSSSTQSSQSRQEKPLQQPQQLARGFVVPPSTPSQKGAVALQASPQVASPASVATVRQVDQGTCESVDSRFSIPQPKSPKAVKVHSNADEGSTGGDAQQMPRRMPIPGVPIPPENTLIILDYDDTLLPTNWAAVQNRVALNDPVPPELLAPLAELSDIAIQTIDACLRAAMVVIVTNASVEWVSRSGEKFIPDILRHVQSQGIEIISARDRLQSTGLPQRRWKTRVFEEIINDVFGDRLRDGTECSVISIGDGDGEREACLEMCRTLGVSEWFFKSLKLLAQPTCSQLISEHMLIQQAFTDIMKVRQSLDMAILDYKNNSGEQATPPGQQQSSALSSPCTNGSPAARPLPLTPPSVAAGMLATPNVGGAAGATTLGSLHRAPSVCTSAGRPSSGTTVVTPPGSRLGGETTDVEATWNRGSSATLCQKHTVLKAAEPLPNTDAFVDLISDQLKSQHEPTMGAAVSMTLPRSNTFTSGGSTLAEKVKLLRR